MKSYKLHLITGITACLALALPLQSFAAVTAPAVFTAIPWDSQPAFVEAALTKKGFRRSLSDKNTPGFHDEYFEGSIQNSQGWVIEKFDGRSHLIATEVRIPFDSQDCVVTFTGLVKILSTKYGTPDKITPVSAHNDEFCISEQPTSKMSAEWQQDPSYLKLYTHEHSRIYIDYLSGEWLHEKPAGDGPAF